jgi:hypothetical protein
VYAYPKTLFLRRWSTTSLAFSLLPATNYDGVQAKHKPLLVFAFSLASMAAVVMAWGSTVIQNKIPRANCRCCYYYYYYYYYCCCCYCCYCCCC